MGGAINAYMQFAIWARMSSWEAGTFYPPAVIKQHEKGARPSLDRRRRALSGPNVTN